MTINHQPISTGNEEEHYKRLPTTGVPSDSLDEWLGSAPTEKEAEQLTQLSLARVEQLVEDLRKVCIKEKEVEKRLGVDSAEIQAFIDEKKILALDIGGERLFPACQFDTASSNRTVAGLSQVLQVLDFSPLTQALWLTCPHRKLDNRIPIELLREGCIELVVDAAEIAGHGQD
jgi:hypothetical protein